MSHILIPAVSALNSALFSRDNSHPGLRQQVIAVRIKNLSKEINELITIYDKSLEQIAKTRKSLNRVRKSTDPQAILQLKAKLLRQERELLSSQIPVNITRLNAQIKQLNHQILDEE